MLACAPVLAASLALAGCDHGDAWAPGPVPVTAARIGSPRRLTFNPEGDHWPAFLRDGSAIGYSYHPLERTDRDRCLAFIPPEGGMIMQQICRRGLHEAESLNVVTTHGVSAGGRIALMAESGIPRRLFPDTRSLWLGWIDGRGPLVEVKAFPYTTAGGQFHLSAKDMTWPDDSTLVYLATFWSYRPPNNFVPPDTEYTGIELVQLRLRGDAIAGFTVVPGTLGASSLTPGPRDTVYFTMGGDSKVYALATGTGQIAPVYDFGALGIARDARIENGTLTAIVGGRVTWYYRASWNLQAQADSGGPIYAVHLPNGTPQLIVGISPTRTAGTHTYRHLALDPTGHHVVAERSDIIERRFPTFTDTVVGKESDLWLFDVP